MLATALTQTSCFEVQERAQLDEIMITGSITSLGFEQSATGSSPPT